MEIPGIQSYGKLYLLTGLLLAGVVAVATGGGLLGRDPGMLGEWQHWAFQSLCHQIPSRSFWVNGIPMAVCSRCYGIYTALASGWLAIPLLGRLGGGYSTVGGYLLAGAVALNLGDVIGNLLGFWQNTLVSRNLAGAAVGIALVIYLADRFTVKTGNLSIGKS